ncbi:acyl-CoA dehydrogenase family protein [Hyphomonas sp. FCG-A18]|uniref:acyl-CoA dehydrogenase family protein n=1 Tax=Hyphomonas sp. FCG-A18 TaxID=3080019 RepID=UPI002B2EA1D7|nr:acyl-CoA dehydrogenase family protein [Hyphomonas sp. FCG-A18]
MSFVLSEDQQMLRDTAEAFARDELAVSHLRGLRDSGANGVDPETRQKLAELGFFGVLIPEEYGGVGMGMVAMGQIMEMQGRTIATTPLLQTAVLGASLITMAGSEAQKSEWLPKVASGEVTLALALDEGTHHAPLNISTQAESDGQGYTLNGAKRFVTDGQHADMFLIVARTFGEAGQSHGLSLFLVPRDAGGLSIQTLNTVDSHGAAHLSLEDVHVPEIHLIGAADAAWETLEPALDRGRMALAAEMLGSSQAAFEMTLEYLQTRKQFGQLIGSFQSMQHRAAKMFTDLEMTRSCVTAALSGVDENRNDLAELASLAKARASELVHLVSNETVQMHGGIGMTDDHDSGLYMKRARVQEALLGGASYHRDRYARLNGF